MRGSWTQGGGVPPEQRNCSIFVNRHTRSSIEGKKDESGKFTDMVFLLIFCFPSEIKVRPCACFSSMYTKIGMTENISIVPAYKDDTQSHEPLHVFYKNINKNFKKVKP